MSRAKRAPAVVPALEPPVVTPVGNLWDLLESAGERRQRCVADGRPAGARAISAMSTLQELGRELANHLPEKGCVLVEIAERYLDGTPRFRVTANPDADNADDEWSAEDTSLAGAIDRALHRR